MLKHTTKNNTYEGIKGELPVVEHLYGVIDSRIQILDKKIREKFGHVTNPSPSEKTVLSDVDEMNWVFSNHEYFLSYLEEYSKTVNRLLLLRTHANKHNIQLMLYLLEKIGLSNWRKLYSGR